MALRVAFLLPGFRQFNPLKRRKTFLCVALLLWCTILLLKELIFPFDLHRASPYTPLTTPAQVAELVDALASGASIGNDVEVRVLSWAPFLRSQS